MYQRLRDLREDKDLSIRQLAEILHMQRTTYHNYETGKRDFKLEHIRKLCFFFNVSADYILGLINEPRPLKAAKK